MQDPLRHFGIAARPGQKRPEVLRGVRGIAPPQQQECQTVVRADQALIEFERPPIVSDRFLDAAALRQRDRDVLEDPDVVGLVAERELIRRDRTLDVTVSFERHALVEVVEALGRDGVVLIEEDSLPPAHAGAPGNASAAIAGKVGRARGRGNAPPDVSLNLLPTHTEVSAMPRQRPAPTRDILDADWAFFGELCRALALKVARSYDPEIVIGVAKAGVIPAAIIASILQREFAAMVIGREADDAAPQLRIGPPPSVRGRRVLVVDETCDTGDTMKLALNEVRKLHPAEVRTAVSFTTGGWRADYHAFETDKAIILPWDREVIEDGELVTRPDLRAWLARHDQPGSTSAG